MRRTKADAEQTRQDLIKAGERVFGRQGFSATRLSDIAKEAGVTRGAIYHHFGNKMDLFIALHNERVDPYFKMVEGILKSDLSPKQKIQKMMTELIFLAKDDLHFAASQRFGIFRDMEFHNCEEIRQFMRKRGELFFAELVKIIKEGQSTEDIRQDIDPEQAAFNLVAYIKGITSMMAIEKSMVNPNYFNEKLVDTFLKGM